MIHFKSYGDNHPVMNLRPEDVVFFEQDNGSWFVNQFLSRNIWGTHPFSMPTNWFLA